MLKVVSNENLIYAYRLGVHFLRFNYSDNQLIPSLIPVPSVALLAYICHGRSVIESNSNLMAISSSESAFFMSALFARNRIGIDLPAIS